MCRTDPGFLFEIAAREYQGAFSFDFYFVLRGQHPSLIIAVLIFHFPDILFGLREIQKNFFLADGAGSIT